MIDEPPSAVKAVKSTYKKQQQQPRTKEQMNKTNQPCRNCDGMRHNTFKECPNYGKECTWCGIKNHLEKNCRAKANREKKDKAESPKVKKVTAPTEESSSDDEHEIHLAKRTYHKIYKISDRANETNDTPRLLVTARPVWGLRKTFQFHALPDTGATHSVIGMDVVQLHGAMIQTNRRDKLFTANDEQIQCAGRTNLTINGISINFIVTPAITNDMLISWHDLIKLKVIPADFPNPQEHKVRPCKTTKTPSNLSIALEKIFSEFNDVLSDKLPNHPMNGQDMLIEIDSEANIKPKKVTTARPIPVHWQKEAKDMIAGLIKDGIIKEVHDETTDWVSPAFFVPKPNGKIRLVTDFSHLNKAIKRPVHPFPSAQDIVQDVPMGTKYFLKLDALQGYHQIPLAKKSQDLTTFLLPMGKYKYLRGPMGLRSTNDVYCARSDRTIEGVPNCHKIVDDILICADSEADLLQKTKTVLSKCRELSITISRKKVEYGPDINFAGFHLSRDGIRPDASKTKAIADFPTPKNVTDLRSFMGLANQLGGFIDNLANTTEPLRA